jgi:hypothetical protein
MKSYNEKCIKTKKANFNLGDKNINACKSKKKFARKIRAFGFLNRSVTKVE